MRYVSTLNYRNKNYLIYLKDEDQKYYTFFNDKLICLGSGTEDIKKKLHAIVDISLDTVHFFEDYPGIRLEWFKNGTDYRDLRLIMDDRILKIFLVTNINKVTVETLMFIQEECEKIIKNYLS